MTKNSKIIIVTSAVIAGIGILYFGIRYIALVQAYNNHVTEDAANTMIENATINITDDTLIPDETTDAADLQKGSEVNEEDLNACSGGMTWDYELQMCVQLK